MFDGIDIRTADRAMTGQVLALFDLEGELSGYAEAALADPNGTILVALSGDLLVGAVITREFVGADRVRRGGIDEVLVSEAYRGRGVGRALMDAAEAHWRELDGVAGMQLTVDASNAAAMHLYESLGYREVQRRSRMYKNW